MVRQFAYVHGDAEISLFSEKNTECGNTVFFLKKTLNPNLQNNNFYILCTGFTMSTTAWASAPWTKS